MIFLEHINLYKMKRILIIWALLIGTVYAQSKAGFYVVGGKVITVQDTSSRNYLKAIENAGVVPSVLQNAASNYLVTSEKAIGSYSLMKAQYPFIGGTAATHKFNLNNPVDTDAGFRLTYGGTITHSANGMQGDGSTGFAHTFINPSISLSNTSSNLSFFSNAVSTQGVGVDIGTTSSISTAANILETASATTFNQFAIGNNSTIDFIRSNSNKKGFINSKISGTTISVTINGAETFSKIGAISLINTTSPLTIAGRNSPTGLASGLFSNRPYQYVGIGSALTNATMELQQSRIVTFFNSMQNR